MTRDEKNRRIAERLGWTVYRSEDGRFDEWVSPQHLHYVKEAGFTHSAVGACSVRLPNFYADEAASALMLEAMPAARLVYYPDAKTWECSCSWVITDLLIAEDPDRKTAIAEAFLKWIESEG